MKKYIVLIPLVLLVGCDYNLGPTINNNNTNTNTNSNNNDFHDLINFAPAVNPAAPVPTPNGGTETPLPLPLNAEQIATNYATANPTLVATSCPDTAGEAGWKFMDGLVGVLKASDARWGYMVKANTGMISRDVIGYRATSDDIGSWGVDVIVDLCGTSPKFAWQVLGFDANAKWSGTRF